MSLAEAARTYSELGWALLPLNGKNPIGHGWEKTQPLDAQSAEEIWRTRNGLNMGIVLGPSGVIDFELDSGDEELFWELAGGHAEGWQVPTPVYLTGSGKPHVLFKDPGGLSRRTRDGLELRAGPHQSVIPPSIHPQTGKPYKWIHDPSVYPLADPPQELLRFFAEPGRGSGDGHWREALRRRDKLSVGEGRHASMVSFFGKIVNVFDDLDDYLFAAQAYCEMAHDPPYPEDVIEKQAMDIWHRYRDVPETPAAAKEYLHIVSADKIEMRPVRFLWKTFFQRAAFHLLVGPKGAGKGSTLAWAAAQVTMGQLGDDPPRAVLWIATEDSFEIDVKPRFVAQGGEERLLLCVQQSILLPKDMPAIKAVCQEYGVGMVVIDPIVGVIGGVDSNAEGPIVSAIGGLNQLADELDLCVIGVRHLGKGNERGVLERVLGNVAWVNTPRAVIGISQEDQGFERKVTMELLAGNRTRAGATTQFHLGDRNVPGLSAPVSFVVPSQ